jgi:hypothetical protein
MAAATGCEHLRRPARTSRAHRRRGQHDGGEGQVQHEDGDGCRFLPAYQPAPLASRVPPRQAP